MLSEVHQVVEELIYDGSWIDPAEVDVSFDAPTPDLVDKLVRPTINLHLIEVHENMELRQTQFQPAQANGTTAVFRAFPRRVDFAYMVSALTTNTDDAFKLLWRVLEVLIREPELSSPRLSKELTLGLPVVARVAQPDSTIKLLDVWSSVGTDPRPAFTYVLTLPLDLDRVISEPLVLSRAVGYRRLASTGRPDLRAYMRGLVRADDGVPVEDATVMLVGEPTVWTRTDRGGVFILRTPAEGQATVRIVARDGRTMTVDLVLPSKENEFVLNSAGP